MRGIYLLLLSLGLLVGACDSQNLQESFVREASQPPSGYTQTDARGQVLRVDPDDWRTAPVFAGVIRFNPAYPNPTRGEAVTLPFTVLQFNVFAGGLIVRGYTDTGRFVLLDEEPEASQPGAYAFVFSPHALSSSGDIATIRGLHRIFVFDARGELVTYGDIMID